jgi:D-lactate dehydrogenase
VRRAAAFTAAHWRTAERAARAALATAAAVRGRAGDRPPAAATALARSAAEAAGLPGRELIPGWLPELPGAAPALPRTRRQGAAAVYFPSCVNRIFGPPARTGGWAPAALVALAERAGVPLWIPPDVAGTCCATVFRSKGFAGADAVMANRVVEHAWAWTGGGRLPVVVDSGSCAVGLGRDVVPHLTEANRELHAELAVVDAVVWAAEHLLPRLPAGARAGAVVLHPTCVGGPGADAALRGLAEACAEEVVVPDDAGCCGFAGDRGMLHPELTASATRREAEEVAGRGYDAYLSCNRLCEVALERATGEVYESVFAALCRAQRLP